MEDKELTMDAIQQAVDNRVAGINQVVDANGVSSVNADMIADMIKNKVKKVDKRVLQKAKLKDKQRRAKKLLQKQRKRNR